jgi:hypothetical protein
MNKLFEKPIFNGLMLGLIIPILVLFIWYYTQQSSMSFEAFSNRVLSKTLLPSTIRFCVFANLPFFLLFNFIKRFEVCIGIFISTILYVLLMLIYRFVI